MKRIIVIFGLTLSTLISCSENGAKKSKETIVTTVEPVLNNESSETTNDSSETDLSQIITQPLNLYQLYDLEESTGKKVGFISLSDIYPLSDHKDSLAIPDLDNIRDKKELQYFVLSTKYRKRFLDKTGITESDSVFVYDYLADVLLSFPVKSLNVSANLNAYAESGNQYDYEIGFGINNKLLDKLNKYSNLVFVGKKNPFAKGQMKPMVWKEIHANEFPSKKKKLSNAIQNGKRGKSYLYDAGKYQYFIQDFYETGNSEYIIQRHLIVVDKQNNGKVIIERLFINGEGSSVAPLNGNPNYPAMKEQWTGKLLKDKPEVVFGFEWFSFGCPNIFFLDSQEKDIYINCDNRH